MTIQKEYQFNGLYLRKSDLTINPEYASYATNCALNYSRELRKRNGLSLEATMPVGKPIIYLTVYKQENELLSMASDGLYKKVGANFVKIPMSITGSIPTWTADCTSIELNGTLYISDTSGINPVFKYDGIVFTRAGIPKPEVNSPAGLIKAPFTEPDDYFGYAMESVAGFNPNVDPSILFVLDKKPTGTIWTFLNTTSGYELITTPALFNLPYVAGIAGSFDGNTLGILTAVPNTGTGNYDVTVRIYNRTVSSLNYTLLVAIPITTGTFPIDITLGFNFVMDLFGFTFALSGIFNFSDAPVISYSYNGVSAWLALPVLTPVQVNSRFGYTIDITNEDGSNEVSLIVGAPGFTAGAFTPGQAYIYHRAVNAIGAWPLQRTLVSPNSTTAGTRIFGEYVNISPVWNTPLFTNKLEAYVSYALPTATAFQVAIYNYDSTVDTWSAAPIFLTAPNNDKTYGYGYKVLIWPREEFFFGIVRVVSSPRTLSGTGTTTYGKVFVYSNDPSTGAYSLVQTFVSPDVSIYNDENSKLGYNDQGFGGSMILDPQSLDLIVGYPSFNYPDINKAGKVFSYNYNIQTGLFSLDNSTSSENRKFMRIYETYVDANGNIINSEAVTIPFNGETVRLTLKTFRNTWYNDRYFLGDTTIAIGQITNATPTLTIPTISHNLIAGDKVLVKTYTINPTNLNDTYPHEFQLLTVVSVTANSVTLRTSELISGTYVTNRVNYKGTTVTARLNGSNAYWNIFVSDDEFFGYQLIATLDAQDIITDEATTITINLSDIHISEDVDIFLNDIYDDTVLKKEIPHIRYLGTYQNLLLGANVRYPEEQEKAEFKNRFIWSDASIGGSAETFAPLDYDVIGENISQELTGIMGTQDNVHIFKNRKCYAVSGLLIGGQYRVRELISEETGCVNHNSLISVKGQVIFMSEAGVYGVAGGNNPKEVTDANQPLFLSPNIDLYKSVATMDGKFERVYIFLKNTVPANNIILVWDYYFDQWFIYDGIPLTGPMIMYNDKLNAANGIELKEMKDSVFMDYISPILSSPVYFKYYTGWHHMNAPSLRKKFVNLVLFSILKLRDFAALPFLVSTYASEPPNFSIDVKTQIDWIALDTDNFNVPFAIDKRVDDHKIAITQSKSLRFLFENNRNEPVLLTGYEFEWEHTQEKPKGLK